jgi:ArsR family transcriptional regulator
MTKLSIKLFKALSNKTRIGIVKHLAGSKEISCQKMLQKFPLSQPTLSHHFNKLIDANLVRVRREGVNHFYSINQQFLLRLGINIQKLIKNL